MAVAAGQETIGKAYGFVRSSLWLDLFFIDRVNDSGSASVAGVIATFAWAFFMISYAAGLISQISEPPIATTTPVVQDEGACSAIQGFELGRSPFGYYIRAHGTQTVAANSEWLPERDGALDTAVVRDSANFVFLEHAGTPKTSGVAFVGPAEDSFGAAEGQTVHLCAGGGQYLELQPVLAPVAVQPHLREQPLRFLSGDLSRALFLGAGGRDHVLADMAASPPAVLASSPGFRSFRVDRVRQAALEVVQVHANASGSVWSLASAAAFLQGPVLVDPAPAADPAPAEDLAAAVALAASMGSEAEAGSVWERPQTVFSVTPSAGDTATTPAEAGAAGAADAYLDAGTSWVLASLGNDGGLESASGYLQLMTGGGSPKTVAMAEPNVNVLSVNSPRGALPSLPVPVEGSRRTLYYGPGDFEYAVEYVRDGTAINAEVAAAFEEAGLAGPEPQLLAVLPLRSRWLGLREGVASGLDSAIGFEGGVGRASQFPAEGVVGGRLGPVQDLSLGVRREVSEDGSERVTTKAAQSEIVPQPCLFEHAPCMRVNLAQELSRVDLTRRFSILTAPGAIGGFSAGLLGLLGLVVTVLKALNVAGRRVAVKTKALIVGELVEDNDDATLDKAAAELEARDAEIQRRKTEGASGGEEGLVGGATQSPLEGGGKGAAAPAREV